MPTDITETVREQVADSEAASSWLNPDYEHITWQVEGADAHGTHVVRQYVQEELSFFLKQDFIVLMNRYLDQFIGGEFGLSMKDLFEGDLRQRIQIPDKVDPEVVQKSIEENIGMIQAIIKIIDKIPGFQHDIVVIALGIPEEERKWALRVLRGPISRGGLTDDQGFLILKTFITQNARAIRDFFESKGRDLMEHAQREILGEDSETSSDEPEEEEKTETEEAAAEPEDSPGGTPSSTIAAAPASIP